MSFTESLLEPSRRPEVVTAVANVIEGTIEQQSGLSGMAMKTAFNGARKANPGMVAKGVDKLLPEMARALEPYWDTKGDQDFGAFLGQNSSAASDALLKVADEAAAKNDNSALDKVYKGMRGKAKGIVEQALPKLGQALAPFAA